MAEIVNIVVAIAVIYFVVRWATKSSGDDSNADRAAARALRFKPKRATPEMIDTVATMFPDLPRANIHYDLLRTGSTEMTATKILEKGFLEAPPPAYFTLYPATAQPTQPTRPAAPAAGASSRPTKARENLIQRFHLQEKVTDEEPISEAEVGGKAVWEDTAEKREASLRERKEKMILAARQRLLAQQQSKTEKVA